MVSNFFIDYDEFEVIYEAAATQIRLVRSTLTDELYIIKRLDKSSFLGRYSLEADILIRFEHRGIPKLFDIYEDETYFYIAMEYICGISLEEYLYSHDSLSRDTFYKVAFSLCDIFSYMHSQGVLYMDLKPEHIIIRDDEVILIDYGAAYLMSDSQTINPIFGTRSYASAEAIRGDRIGEYSDIYSVGIILRQMADKLEGRQRRSLLRVIARATRKNPAKRLGSIRKLEFELRRLYGRNYNRRRKLNLRGDIVVVGEKRGVGCTHIAISLASYLNRAGCSAYYRNETGERVVENMLDRGCAVVGDDGLIYHEHFIGTHSAGEFDTSFDLCIRDCGTRIPKGADNIVLILNDRPWSNVSDIIGDIESGVNIAIVCNLMDRRSVRRLCKKHGVRAYIYPYVIDAFSTTRSVRRVFTALIDKELCL